MIGLRSTRVVMVSIALWMPMGVAGAQVTGISPPPAPVEPPPPLVPGDAELADYVVQTEALLADGQVEQALRNIQALAGRAGTVLIATEDGRRYISLQQRLNDLIAGMDADALRRYRLLYDPQAARLTEQGIAGGDEALLRRVVRRYVHTSSAGEALAAMGHLAFDRGAHVQAGRWWLQAAERADDAQAALLLAKAAVAFHLASRPDRAQAIVDRLAKAHSQVTARIAGREQPLLSFVQRVREGPAAEPAPATNAWPGYGAAEGGRAMGSISGVMLADWRFGDLGEHPQPIAGQVNTSTFEVQAGRRFTMDGGHVVGHVMLQADEMRHVLPAYLLPIVVDGRLVLRDDEEVVACDLASGEILWRQVLPMRHAKAASGRRVWWGAHSSFEGLLVHADAGRYWLTAADDAVLALHGYVWPKVTVGNDRISVETHSGVSGVTSQLSALSLSEDGRVLWSLPDPDRGTGIDAGGAVVSPPTVSEGRVYVMMAWADTMHVVCVDAGTGKLIWSAPAAEMPVITVETGTMASWMRDRVLQRASPPAVADGVVIGLTNVGVVVACDAHSGEPLWAYHYDSSVNDPDASQSWRAWVREDTGPGPINPLIVVDDRVICRPADSNELLCLSAADGQRLWQIHSMGLAYLSRVGDSRVLLTEPGLAVVNVTGPPAVELAIHADQLGGGNMSGAYGRPAVTTTEALISGAGQLIRLDLTGRSIDWGSVSFVDAPGDEPFLGNVVTAEGRLILANAMGVSICASYEMVRTDIEGRLSDAGPVEQVDLLCRAAKAALKTDRIDQAQADLARARAAASKVDASSTEIVAPTLYEAFVAVGRRLPDPRQMAELYAEAERYAPDLQQQAETLLRRAKIYAAVDAERALQLSDEIVQRFDETRIADVDPRDPISASVGTIPVRTAIHERFIPSLLQRHGPAVYAAIDAQAQQAYDLARSAGDVEGLVEISRRWPNSQWADDALLAAAELDYDSALVAADDDARRHFERADRHLLAAMAAGEGPVAVSASFGRVLLHVRRGHEALAALASDETWRLARRACGEAAGDMAVRFADVEAPLRQALSDALARNRSDEAPAPERPQLALPLRKVMVLGGPGATMLADGQGDALALDGDVFVCDGADLMRVDPRANDAADAAVWRQAEALAVSRPSDGSLAALDSAEAMLVIAGTADVQGRDAGTGEIRWRWPATDEREAVGLSARDGRVAILTAEGALTCLSAADGAEIWRVALAPPSDLQRVTVRAAPGVVTVIDAQHRRAWRLGTRNGRTLGEALSGQVSLTGAADGDGAMVFAADGVVTAFDGGAPAPLWQRTLPDADVIGLAPGRVVLGYGPNDRWRRIEVVGLSDGRSEVRLEAPRIDDRPTEVRDVTVWGDQLFLLLHLAEPDDTASPATYAARIDMAARRTIWRQRVAPAGASGMAFAPVLTDDHVVVDDGRARAVVRSLRYGSMAESGRTVVRPISGVAGRPAVVGRRLLVPTDEGLEVYGQPH